MQIFQALALAFCAFLLAAFLWPVLREWRKQNRAGREKEAKLARRLKLIEDLAVPPSVMARAKALLGKKGVKLDANLESYMVQGFKDYLIAVHYVRRGSGPWWRESVAMTSDTIDMLWHAWLEDGHYEETFTSLLGFPLAHLPEAPERAAAQRGPGNVDFLKNSPPRRAVSTYRALMAALPEVGRNVNHSGLYLLDTLARNRDGFYYDGAILAFLRRAELSSMPGGKVNAGAKKTGSGCGSACTASGDGHTGACSGHGCGSGCGH